MNRAARYLFASALGAAITFSLPCRATSGADQPGRRSEVSSADKRSGGDREEKWERDPIVFTVRDRDAIREYYAAASAGAAHRILPQRRRKHLLRNSALETALQNRIAPFSEDLELRLHPLDSGYSRGTIGQDGVIIEDRTQRIMDVLRNATVVR